MGMYNTKQTSKILKVTTTTLFRWVKLGKIKAIKYGENTSKLYFEESEIKRFLNNHKVGG